MTRSGLPDTAIRRGTNRGDNNGRYHLLEPITGRFTSHRPAPPDVRRPYFAALLVVLEVRLSPAGHPGALQPTNINSDEVIYYVAGNFMSRRGVGIAYFTPPPGRHSPWSAPGPRPRSAKRRPKSWPATPTPSIRSRSPARWCTSRTACATRTWPPADASARANERGAGRRRSRRSTPDDRIDEGLELRQRAVFRVQDDDHLTAIDRHDEQPGRPVGAKPKPDVGDPRDRAKGQFLVAGPDIELGPRRGHPPGRPSGW